MRAARSPAWDEPDLKAVFGVTLVVAPDLAALSNGPEIERTRSMTAVCGSCSLTR